MDHVTDERRECELRIEAAVDLLESSSAKLMKVLFSGPREAIESAYADLRFARVRFMVATEEYRETLHEGLGGNG
jgi:hypothetical protein